MLETSYLQGKNGDKGSWTVIGSGSWSQGERLQYGSKAFDLERATQQSHHHFVDSRSCKRRIIFQPFGNHSCLVKTTEEITGEK